MFVSQRSISENSLVAMDFSGQKSRVIENPTEALSVAVEEGLAWRVRIGSRSLKVFALWVCFARKADVYFPSFVQKKGCLRLGTHGSPTASAHCSATNMGTSTPAGPRGREWAPATERVRWGVPVIHLQSFHTELCVPSLFRQLSTVPSRGFTTGFPEMKLRDWSLSKDSWTGKWALRGRGCDSRSSRKLLTQQHKESGFGLLQQKRL